MRILIAEDDRISRKMLAGILTEWGHEVTVASDGDEAWHVLEADNAPKLAILDWEMPGQNGPEICKRLREKQTLTPAYVILLTSRTGKPNIVAGLRAGANDYLTKPFDQDELLARVQVGKVVTDLQASLSARVHDLEAALAQVKQLQGLLPICAWCKKIRDDQNYWQVVEDYLMVHSEIRFSHGICPDCLRDQMRGLSGMPKEEP